jgi:hypothetical protein
MDRAETAGLSVALAAHGALIAALSLAVTRAPPISNQPIEVAFVDEAGLVSAAPMPSAAEPAPSIAPELGTPEDAVPQPAEPVPPPRPAALPKALPKTSPADARPNRPADRPAAEAPRGSRLGKDLLKGLGADPSPSRSLDPPAATMSAQALASIKAVIERQIQPCADRQRDPGPGANQIRVTLNLRLNRDGSLAQQPAVVRTTGVDAQNSRYEARVRDLAVAAYVGCSPLRGLPEDLYRTPKGGWNNLNMTYRLP